MASEKRERRHPLYDDYAETHEFLYDVEEVCNKTIAHERECLDWAAEIASAWYAPALFLLESPYHRGRETENEYVFECHTDSFGSIVFATHGYYKAAIASLRSLLENALLAIRFERTGRNPVEPLTMDVRVPGWRDLVSELKQPPFQHYAREMTAHDDQYFGDLVNPAWVTETVYTRVLSKTVHGHPATFNLSAWHYDVRTEYDADTFDNWAGMFQVANCMSLLWVLLGFRPLFWWTQHDDHFTQVHPVHWDTVLSRTQLQFFEEHAERTRL